jgi:hypothetical protein
VRSPLDSNVANSELRRRNRLKLGAALAAALCLSACGGAKQSAAPPPPTLSRSLGASLAAQSTAVADALAAGDSCRALALAHTLQQRTIAAINQGRVAAGLQEQLSGAVNSLVSRVTCVPPAPPEPAKKEHGHGKHKGHDKKHEGND